MNTNNKKGIPSKEKTNNIIFNSYREYIAHITEADTPFYTNIYNCLEEWFDSNILLMEQSERTVIILKQRDSYIELFFYTTNLDELADHILKLDKYEHQLVISLIYHQDKTLISYFENNSFFYIYGGIVKLTAKKSQLLYDRNTSDTNNIVYPDENDVKTLQDMHHKVFNKFIDSHLSIESIIKMINDKNILVYKENNNILAVITFIHKENKCHIQYWFKNPDIKTKNAGKKLFFYLLNQIDENTLVEIWSRKDNSYITAFYEQLGFKQDSTNWDTILIKHHIDQNDVLKPLYRK